jgi:ribosomal protein S18 acetylase RimI-like enzyme
MVTYEWSDWRDANLWWIQSVYVAVDWRRRGVFRSLYGHVREAALAAGACGIRLYVERENSAAQQTYRSLGMSVAPYLIMSEMLGSTS